MAVRNTTLQRRISATGLYRFRPAALLMNLTVYPLLILWSICLGALFPLYYGGARLLFRWEPGRLMRYYIWIYGRGWLAIVAPFVRFRREGFERATVPTPCVFVVNHNSFFDTYFMGGLPLFDVAFAVRSWPFRMFWYAYFMRLAGYLDVEGDEWETSLVSCRRTIDSGGSILFFPEGHRSRDGHLQRFYSGAFRLALELNVPLVPLCLTGTEELLPPGRQWLQPAAVRLRVLPAVDPAAYAGDALGYVRFRRDVRDMMAREVASMREEGS